MTRPLDAVVLGAGALAVAAMSLAAEAVLLVGARCLTAATEEGPAPGPTTILALDDGDAP